MQHTKVCKIQILPVDDFKGTYKYIRDLMGKVCEMSNDIIRKHFFTQMEMSDYRKSGDKISAKMASDMIKEKYGQSIQNIGYDLSKKYDDIPSHIRTAVNQNIYKSLKKLYWKVETNQISLPSFTKDSMPIDFMWSDNISKTDKDYFLRFTKDCRFKLFFGRDKSGVKSIVDKILDGSYKACGSSIIIKKNKIYLYLVFQFTKEDKNVDLDYSKVLGIDLGINRPVSLGRNDDKYVPQIMIGEKIQHTRMSIYKQRRSLQRGLRYSSGGRGRNNKLSKLEDLKSYEHNFVEDTNHKLSRSVIDYCLKEGVGTIHMEDLTNITKDVDNYFLKSWSFYQFQQMIEYKAKEVGIQVLYVDPKYTSQICSCCGNHDAEQRQSTKFICSNEKCDEFGVERDADINAAINISMKEGYIDKPKKSKKKNLEVSEK
jgi:putative transposase